LKNKLKLPHFSVLISAEECKACGKCIVACPKRILIKGNKINSYGFKYVCCVDEFLCIGCGNCFYSCPEPGAITIYKNSEENSEGEMLKTGKSKNTNEREKKCSNIVKGK